MPVGGHVCRVPMCTRGTWQLKELVIKYCVWGGSSSGVRWGQPVSPIRHPRYARRACTRRNYLETRLVPFARANPQIEITVSKSPAKHPHVQALYVADGTKAVSLRNYSAHQVASPSPLRWTAPVPSAALVHAPQVDTVIAGLRDSRPVRLRKWDKPFRSSPSVQGEWRIGQKLDRPHTVISSG